MRRETRRNNRPNSEQELDTKKISIAAGVALALLVIVFIVIYNVYQSNMARQIEISRQNTNQLMNIVNSNMIQNGQTQSTSSGSGKTVNEMKNEMNQIESVNKNAIADTSAKKEENKNVIAQEQLQKTEEQTVDTNAEMKQEEKNADSKNATVENTEAKNDPTFKMPVDGTVIREYAKDKLVYSETLKEWITHPGIDIKADKTSVVKASADGKVKSIKNDPRYGLTVVIEHANGFTSVYSNLLTAEFVKANEEVKQGQTIGTVGESATFEIADGPHLHFEILKNSVNVDPNMYLK